KCADLHVGKADTLNDDPGRSEGAVPRAQLYVAGATRCSEGPAWPAPPDERGSFQGVFAAVAIVHFSASIVSRGDGRSAVLSAAYRRCAKMDYEREARSIDYSRKQGLLHEKFLLPSDAPEWARMLIADRSVAGATEAFWNKVEAFEKRSDAQLA